MKKNSNKLSIERYRNWIFIVYPESAPSNWQDIITDTGFQWAHSPLHDKDVEEYGGVKKAHYHCIIKYASLKSYRQVLSLTGKLHAPNPQPCNSIIGKVRYFLHLDSPNKFQYSKKEVRAFNGFDIEQYLKPSKSEKDSLLKEVRQFIRENDVTELADLMDYADTESPSWARILSSSTYTLNSYITSRRFNRHYNFSRKTDDLKEGFKNINSCYSDGFTQENQIPLIPKGIDIELWALSIKEYRSSCI